MKKLLFFVVALVLSGSLAAIDMQKNVSVGYSNPIQKETSKVLNMKGDRGLVVGFEWEEIHPAWTVIDEDGDGKSWRLSTYAPHTGDKHMYVAFNDVAGNHDWLITPKLTIQSGSELKLWASSQGASGGIFENYNIMISEIDTSPSNFTLLESVTNVPGDYTEQVCDLSAYAGKEIYIAVKCVTIDGFELNLDDFSVSNCTWDNSSDTDAPEFVALTGATAIVDGEMNLVLTLTDATGVPATIEASYNLTGADETLVMTLDQDKGKYVYRGTIPSPGVVVESADITFHLRDIVGNPNTADITKQISFIDPVVEIIDEDFEDFTPFSVDPQPYIFLDLDGDETYPWQDINFENEGYTGSFITFAPLQASPPQDHPGIIPHSGEKFLGCLASMGDKKNNDWMISPQIVVGADYSLQFWAKSHNDGFGLERFRVGVSTTGIDPEDFTIISEEDNAADHDYVEAPTEWKKYSFDLSDYAGKGAVRFAINCVSEDAFMFMVDDIRVGVAGADMEVPEFVSLEGNIAENNTAMNLSLTVSDESGIASPIIATYNVGNGDQTIEMTPSKDDFTFAGTIPAQTNGTAGVVSFEVTDASDLANSTEFGPFDIKWETVLPYWAEWGANYEDHDTGLGFHDSDWRAASDFYFGDSQVDLASFEIGFSADQADVAWKIVEMTDGLPSENVVGTLEGTFDAVGGEMTHVTITDGTKLSGHVALLVAVDANNYIYRDLEGDMEHTWIECLDAATPINWSLASSYGNDYVEYFEGSWAMRLNVSESNIPVPDTEAPKFVSLDGTTVYAGEDMNLTLKLTDKSGVVSPMIATYTVNGDEYTIQMTQGKGESEFTFTGTIPAQDEVIDGTINFTAVDTAEPANTTVLGPYDLVWEYLNPNEVWYGEGIEKSGGMALDSHSAFQAAVNFVLPEEFNWEAKKIITSGAHDLDVPWKIVNFDGTPSEEAIGSLEGTITTIPPVNFIEYQDCEVEINDRTKINGHIALLLDVPAIPEVEGESNAIAYDAVNGDGSHAWFRSLPNYPWQTLEEYIGSWYLRLLVSKENTGIVEEVIPGNAELYQNYPNPFNPSTTIKFFNNMSGDVKLSIFNVKGELVSTLVNGHMSANYHSVNFDASNLNSGVYYYTLKTPTKSITKKMIMVK